MKNRIVYQISTKAFLLTVITLGIVGCGDSGTGGGITDLNSNLALSYLTQINVSNASAEQCPAGGKVYSIYIDSNTNGAEDPSETPLSSQIVCNGLNGVKGDTGAAGIDGYNALMSTNRVTTNFDSCPSNSGLQISFGLDSDRSGSLDAAEIAKTEILCDGKNGETGAQGAAGSNGHNVVFQSTPASAELCPAGGITTVMALDINDGGFYSAQLPNQSSMTICNGANGQNGQDGQDGQNGQDAVLPAYTPVDIIKPCGNTVAWKEILLRLNNGQVLASFSEKANGQNTRLALLTDGSYVDTDSSNCTFSLSTSGSTRSISWFGSIQKSWSVQ